MEYKVHHMMINFLLGGESKLRKQIIEFELEINELIKQGYEPLGGVSTSREGPVVFISQSLIKKVISS
jgi:hypothetical protein